MASVQESLDFFGKEQKDLEKRVDIITKNNKTSEQIILSLNQQVNLLQTGLNTIQQRERMSNLEIIGIPDKPNENLSEYLLSIAKYADVQLSAQDIEFTTRIQPRLTVPGRHKVIIAKRSGIASFQELESGRVSRQWTLGSRMNL